MNTYLNPRNFGCRITEFSLMGFDALALQNATLRITVLPGKGTDIIEFLHKPSDTDFIWLSYPGLRPRSSFSSAPSDPNASFFDHYPGGWQEVLPNFGGPCVYKGASLGLHGEVCLLPWKYRIIEDDPSCVSVQFSVHCLRTPLSLTKTLTLNQGQVLKIQETLVNESSETVECSWGHHPALGGSFLDETCRVDLPPCQVTTPDDYVSPNSRLEKGQDCAWPKVKGRHGGSIDLSKIPPPSVKSHDTACLYGFKEGWYAVTNQSKKVGFGLAWDSALFKYLRFWQVYRGWAGYPWYGMSYNIGLEPCSSLPPSLVAAIEKKSQITLAPGEVKHTSLAAVVFSGVEKVSRVTLDGDVHPG